MRRLPSKAEIFERARQISSERAVIQGLPAITPTDAELVESGAFHEARIELMTAPETRGLEEQHRYLAEMASELDLKVLEKKSWKLFQRKFGAYRWRIRGLRHLLVKPAIPKSPVPIVSKRTKPKKTILPKPAKYRKPSRIFDPWAIAIRGPEWAKKMISQKEAPKPKRKKRHITRTSKTMKPLRKRIKNGQKVFSFPDNIWRVRKVRK